jgi:hypothetical protein
LQLQQLINGIDVDEVDIDNDDSSTADADNDDKSTLVQCGFTGYSVYNFSNDRWNAMTFEQLDGMNRTLVLLDHYKGRVNIRAETSTVGCPSITIGCVKLKLGNLTETSDSSAPYTLYNSFTDNNTEYRRPVEDGIQKLEAVAYKEKNCVGKEALFTDSVSIKLVRRSSVQGFGQHSFLTSYAVALYSEKTSDVIVSNVVRATCNYIKSAVANRFFQNGSLTYENGFRCWSPTSTFFSTTTLNEGAVVINATDVTITYRVKVKLIFSPNISFYSDPIMPTRNRLTSFVIKVFQDEYSTIIDNTSNIPEVMSTYVERTIKENGLYFDYESLAAYYL